MGILLPTLRGDLTVTPPPVEGTDSFYVLATPDGARCQVATRVYQALTLLTDCRDLETWHRAVASRYPGVTAQQLDELLTNFRRAGLLQDRAPSNGAVTPQAVPHAVPHAVPQPVTQAVPQYEDVDDETGAELDPDRTQISMGLPEEVRAFLASDEGQRIAEETGVAKRARTVPERRRLSAEVTSITRMQAAGAPRAREVAPPERLGTGMLRVISPKDQRPVLLFDAEYQLLVAMDGQRQFRDLLRMLEDIGYPRTPDQLSSLIRDLAGYGFLQDLAGAENGAPLVFVPFIERGRTDAIRQHDWIEAELTYFQSGVSSLRQFAIDESEAFLIATLDANPQNREARRLLVVLEHAKAALHRDDAPLAVTTPPSASSYERGVSAAQAGVGANARQSDGAPLAEQSDDGGEDEVAELLEEALDEGGGADGAEQDAGDEAAEEDQEEGDNLTYADAEEAVKYDPAAVRRRWSRRLKTAARKLLVPAAIVTLGCVIEVPLSVTYPCAIRPAERHVVRSHLDGIIDKVFVKEGQQVEAGEVVAELLANDLRLAVVKSEAGIQRATAELEMLRKGSREEEIARVQARVAGLARETSIARDRVERVQSQVRSGVAPRDELDRARAEYAALSGQLAQARAELKLQKAGSRPDEIRQKEAELRALQADNEVQKQHLEDTLLRARAAGIITTPKPHELKGTKINKGQEVFEVVQRDLMRVEVLVGERDFDILRVGLPMVVKVASLPGQEFASEINRVGEQIQRIDGLNIIRAEGMIENQTGTLMPNMSGYAELTAEEVPVAWLMVRRFVRWVRVRFLI